MQGKIQYVQEINIGRLDARICKDDMATGPSLAGTAAAVATGFTFVRFVAAACNVFVAGSGTSSDDDNDVDDCTASPVHFSACSLDICHVNTHSQQRRFAITTNSSCQSQTRHD